MVRSHSIVGFVLLVSIGYTQGAIAQVSPDGTVGTIVSPGPVFNITGGTRPSNGPNLFHSFSQFSLPTGSSAIFQNDPTVQTIFSRVTGGSRSDINGKIQTQGNASLFLMNPNGIVFGPNAKLELGGSFVGTTANSIQFEDGVEFSSGNLSANPLLTVKLPIGLQMGTNPGAIAVQGSGHLLRTKNPIIAPYFSIGMAPSLIVAPQNTLALVGGNVAIDGGVLTAPEGRVELASIGSLGSVPIFQNNSNIVLGNVIGDRGNIALSNKALVDVNGIDSGSIQVQGKQVDLTTGAILWVQNRGPNKGGDISVNATDRILVDGTSSDFVSVTPGGTLFNSVSTIVNETVGVGEGGKIVLNAPNITVRDGASIISRLFAQGGSGDISINAQTLNIMDASKIVPAFFSLISSTTFGSGKGGNIMATVRNISLLNGGILSAATIGPGDAGNIVVNADTVLAHGLSPTLSNSSLTVPTLGAGNAGTLLLNTRTLTLIEGGFVVASSIGSGNAGSLTINATESIEIVGLVQQNSNAYRSGIGSAVDPPQEPYISLFNLTEKPTGSSGDVKITTKKITISEGSYVSVANLGTGVAGSLMVESDRIELNNDSYLSAASTTGQGGNIIIRSDAIFLRNLSKIYTSAQGNGNGGNISINSTLISGIGNSDIFSNAEAGNGGIITIIAQGLFGLNYRDRLTPENDITASSEFGINGNVQVNTIGINPTNALNALPVDIADSSRQIADRCAASKTGSFFSTGRGGIPQSPIQTSKSDRTWHDLRNIGHDRSPITTVITPIVQVSTPIVEASAIQVDQSGSIALVAPQAVASQSATCGMAVHP